MYLLMNKNKKLLSFSIDTLLKSEKITEKERVFSFFRCEHGRISKEQRNWLMCEYKWLE